MAYNNLINTSIFGRRLGLQKLSSAQSGGSYGFTEVLVGPDAFRGAATTAEVAAPAASGVASNMRAMGISVIGGSTIGGTYTYPLDPPIPGLRKFIAQSSTDAKVLIRLASSALGSAPNLLTSAGSTFNTITLSSQTGSVELIGLTTALWGIVNGSTLTGNSFTTST